MGLNRRIRRRIKRKDKESFYEEKITGRDKFNAALWIGALFILSVILVVLFAFWSPNQDSSDLWREILKIREKPEISLGN